MTSGNSSSRWLPVLVAVLFLAGAATAQQDDKPSWQEALEGVVRDAVEGSGNERVGAIRGIEVVDRNADMVELEVELRQVDDPQRIAFEAEVYDEQMRTLEPIEVSWDEPPPGDGSTLVRLVYAGAGSVTSIGAKLSLVDADTGRVSSRRKVALPWQWRGSGAPSSSQLGAAPADPGGLTTRSDDPGAAEREPVVVDLEPVRIGRTPKPQELKVVTGMTLQSAAGSQPAAAAPSAGSTGSSGGQQSAIATTMVAANLQHVAATVDLYAAAAKAQWRSNQGSLPFNGPTSDRRGFVRPLGSARMIDGKTYSNVLQTHPAWVDNGTISGAFRITVPAGATRFEAKAGFLHGVSRSDGVTATVALKQGTRGTTVAQRRVVPKDGVVVISGEIPSAVRGKEVTLTLTVNAQGTSTQDWFAWSAPVIR